MSTKKKLNQSNEPVMSGILWFSEDSQGMDAMTSRMELGMACLWDVIWAKQWREGSHVMIL